MTPSLRLMLTALALSGAWAHPGHAITEATPFLYQRTSIIIDRNHPPVPVPSLPWQADSAPPIDPALPFDVEIRDGMTLYNQQGWFNVSAPSDKAGILMVFSEPGIAPIMPSNQYAALDILMIDKEGVITQIVPNIRLSELEEEILPASPVLAFLFLRGGACAAEAIHPGDTVRYKLFKRAPTVLQAPPPPAPQIAPQTATPPASIQTPRLPGAPQPIPAKPVETSSGTRAPLMIQSDAP